jgi:hypothetical protein
LNNLKKKVKGAFTLPESESKGILPDWINNIDPSDFF